MLKRIISGSVSQFFSMGVSFFDRFVVTAILLHYWGVGVFEDWSLLIAAVNIMGIFGLGFHNYFGNAYLFSFEQKKIETFERTIKLSIYFNMVAFIVGLFALMLTGFYGSLIQTIGIATLNEKTAILIYFLVGLMVLFNVAAASITELYRAQGQFGRGILINALIVLTRSISLAFLAMLGGGPLAGAATFLALTLMFVFVVIPLDQKRSLDIQGYGLKFPDKSEALKVWHGSKWYFLQNFPALMQLNLPILLIGSMKSSPGIVAAFIMSRTIVNFARQVLQNFTFVFSQELSRFYARKENDKVRELFLASNRFICTITGATLGCLLSLAEPFFMIWSGGTVFYDENLMVIFALTVALSAPATTSLAFLFYIQKARPIAFGRIVQAIISIILAFILVKSYGAIGVAFALLIGETVGLSIFILPSGAKESGISLFTLIKGSITYLIGGFLFCRFVGIGMEPWVLAGGLFEFIMTAIILLFILFITIFIIGLSKFNQNILWHKFNLKILKNK